MQVWKQLHGHSARGATQSSSNKLQQVQDTTWTTRGRYGLGHRKRHQLTQSCKATAHSTQRCCILQLRPGPEALRRVNPRVVRTVAGASVVHASPHVIGKLARVVEAFATWAIVCRHSCALCLVSHHLVHDGQARSPSIALVGLRLPLRHEFRRLRHRLQYMFHARLDGGEPRFSLCQCVRLRNHQTRRHRQRKGLRRDVGGQQGCSTCRGPACHGAPMRHQACGRTPNASGVCAKEFSPAPVLIKAESRALVSSRRSCHLAAKTLGTRGRAFL
eukprot:scaffold105952_cov33-Tisochrysis_lutea.AAC.1